jgi:hypothetical protein
MRRHNEHTHVHKNSGLEMHRSSVF